MKNLIIALLICCSFFSCKKERAFHITATNVATGERIPNLHYYLVELTEGINGEEAKTVREGNLDANGEAKFNFKIKNKTHVIRVVEPENNCYTENISLTFGSKENVKAEFNFAPCGSLKQIINNVNCFDQNDQIEIKISRFVDNNYESPWTIVGCDGFISNHFSQVPMGNYYYKWVVTRAGVSNTFYDTVYVDENEFVTYEINY